jgi:galactonate dehydratase
MKITKLRSMLLEGPRSDHTEGQASGKISKLVIKIETDSGLYGLGEADNFLGVREALDFIENYLVGREPFDVRPIVSEMLYGSLPPHPAPTSDAFDEASQAGPHRRSMSPTATVTGPVVWAVSGVEIALLDLVGKATNMPVYHLLGGRFRDRVQIYLDRSSPREVDNLDAWRKLATDSLSSGFNQIKFDIDCTAPDCTADVWNRSIRINQMQKIKERLEAVREEIGWDVELSVDCHMHYQAPDAIRLAHELAHLKLMWLEDPTPIINPDACAHVKAKSPIPICIGEMLIAEQIRLFIDRDACDVIHPDVMFVGGLHEIRRVADYAELHYLPLALHSNGGCLAVIAAAHAAAAARNFLSLEYHFLDSEWLGAYVKREGLPLFRDGMLPLSDAPGLGVELDAEVCREHLAADESLLI